MRSRDVDVLRPVVELINFNVNVIKISGFPVFSVRGDGGAGAPPGEVCCGITFNSNWTCGGLFFFLYAVMSLAVMF